MSEKDQVLSRLRQVARRLRVRSLAMGVLFGLALTAICCCVLAIAAILTPIDHVPWICLACLAFGALSGLLLAPGCSVKTAAIHADLAAGTDEVLSSAIEAEGDNRFGAAILSQAAGVVKRVPVKTFASTPRQRPPWPLLAPLGVLAALLFAPGLPAPAAEKRTAELSPERLRRLERRARELKNLSVEIESKELAKLSHDMKKLVTQVRQGKMSRKEALAKLAKLQEQARGIRKDLKAQKKSLAELGKNPETKSMADALARGETEKAKRAAKNLAGKLADGKLGAKSKSGLQSALSKMGKDSKASSGALSEAASKASQALGRGDAKGFGEQMSKLAEAMKNARGGRSGGRQGSSGNNKGGPSGQGGLGEFDDALSDLGGAEDDLSNPGSNGQSANNSKPHCENCGRRKKPGGN